LPRNCRATWRHLIGCQAIVVGHPCCEKAGTVAAREIVGEWYWEKSYYDWRKYRENRRLLWL